MRTMKRLQGLQSWLQANVCDGKKLKAPTDDYSEIVRDTPRVFIGYQPTRGEARYASTDPYSVAPSITIMPKTSEVKRVEAERFDQYKKIVRSQELGQELSVMMLFTVYEPGTRFEGFDHAPEGIDIGHISEGTEEGLETLFNWMDETKEKLLGAKYIENTDMFLIQANFTYGLYEDSHYIVDKRPVYYGMLDAEFRCYADASSDDILNELLK